MKARTRVLTCIRYRILRALFSKYEARKAASNRKFLHIHVYTFINKKITIGLIVTPAKISNSL